MCVFLEGGGGEVEMISFCLSYCACTYMKLGTEVGGSGASEAREREEEGGGGGVLKSYRLAPLISKSF